MDACLPGVIQLTASDWPMLLVNDSTVLTSLGISLPAGKEKRDRWTLQELVPHLPELDKRATLIRDKDQRHRSYEETQLLDLASNVHAVDDYVHAFDWARWQTTLDPNESLSLLLPEHRTIDAVTLDRRRRGLARGFATVGDDGSSR